MDGTKAVIKNVLWELCYYLTVIAFGFFAPRFIILIYGSEVNGLSSTITQILNVILILQSGTTTAAIFSLYKPIAENDIEEISKNLYSAEKLFRKLAYIFGVIMLVVAALTASFLKSSIPAIYIFIAFVIMGMKSFLDLYYTSKFRIVFTAYQDKFVISIATLLEQVIYYALVFFTIFARIHFVFLYVWLFVGCVAKVIFLECKYKKKYGAIIPRYKGEKSKPIKGRSYALANEVSHSIVSSSTTIILSFMYGLQEASVYAVYALVSQALTLVSTALYSSFEPSFGSLVAKGNKDNEKRVFGIFQYLYIMLNSVMFFCMIVLVVPFAKIYTSGATDINYANPLLAVTIGFVGVISAYRVPYNIVVSTCGYFKETWKQPVICIFISLLISFIGGLFDYPLIPLGNLVFYFVNFLFQHFRLKQLVPHLISNQTFTMFGISMFGLAVSALVCYLSLVTDGILAWLVAAAICVALSILYICISSIVLLPYEFKASYVYIKTHLLRKLNKFH